MWADGRRYVGEWKDDNRWSGTFYDAHGSVVGIFVNGVWTPK